MFLFLLLDSDCSGRSLATLLVAWVGAAMVASVLLRWKYMWIVLAMLTLLFLVVCGYTACSDRRSGRTFLTEQSRQVECRHTVENDIPTVSGRVNGTTEMEPPTYQALWIADLPPTYASVVGAQPPRVGAGVVTYLQQARREQEEETGVRRSPVQEGSSNPPPYSTAIESIGPTISTSNQTAQAQNQSGRRSPPNVSSIPDSSFETESAGVPASLESDLERSIQVAKLSALALTAPDLTTDYGNKIAWVGTVKAHKQDDGTASISGIGDKSSRASLERSFQSTCQSTSEDHCVYTIINERSNGQGTVVENSNILNDGNVMPPVVI